MIIKINDIDISDWIMSEPEIENISRLNSSDFIMPQLSVTVADHHNQFSLSASNSLWRAFKTNYYNANLSVYDDSGNLEWDGIVKSVENQGQNITTITAHALLSKLLDVVQVDLSTASPATQIRYLINLKVGLEYIDAASFSAAEAYQNGIGFKIDVLADLDDNKTALEICRDIADMSRCFLFWLKGKIYLVQRNQYAGGGILLTQDDFIGVPKLITNQDDIINGFSINHLVGGVAVTSPTEYEDSNATVYDETQGYRQDFSTGVIQVNCSTGAVAAMYSTLVLMQKDPMNFLNCTVRSLAFDFVKPSDIFLVYEDENNIDGKAFQLISKKKNEAAGTIDLELISLESL